MTSRFVRPSKYRHTFPQQGRKEWNYENLKVSSSAWDTDLIKSSPKFLSINYQVAGGGAFSILPLLSPFAPLSPLPTPKLPDLIPLARGHSGAVLDTSWSPHSESFLASAGEDGKILLWDFSTELSGSALGSTSNGYAGKFEGWGEENFTLPSDFTHLSSIPGAGKGRKVGQLTFNPVAKELLASAGGDHVVRIWDLASQKGEASLELKGHGDMVQSMCWAYDGGVIITTARDKKIRLYDPRSGSAPIKVADSHGGIKGSRVCWLGDRNRVVTTGFSRMSDRQMILWDTNDLSILKEETIDSSSGVIMPHYIEGNGVLLLAGKGDGNIRLYEYADDDLFYLTEHKSQDPQRGFTLLPRHAVDVAQNEIARGFKLTTSTVEPIAFVVPRKAESFQADIFPPAPSMEPAFTAQEWLDGKKGPPKFIDMESRASAAYTAPEKKEEKKEAVAPSPPPAQKEEKKEPAPARTPSPVHITEYSKDVIVPPTSEIPETSLTPLKDFELKDLEIRQDEGESDEEETEAKRRAPADDDFEEEAGPSIVDVSGKGKKEVVEVVKEQPVAAQVKSDDGSSAALTSLQTEHSALKKRFEAAQKENEEMKAVLDRFKGLLQKY